MKSIKFFSFLKKRHGIYVKREAKQPWPWTNDPILQTYSFTNIYRELDRVTIWIRKNWREPYADHPNLWFAICIARQINWPETLAEIGFPEDGWDAERATKIMEHRIAKGAKVYTGAYMIRAENDRAKPWGTWSKQRYMSEVVLGHVWNDRRKIVPQLDGTLQSAHEALIPLYGWGPFMAYEVVTDLRHTRYLCNAPDIMTWANAGPGALRGLNRLHGRPTRGGMAQPKALVEMLELLQLSTKSAHCRHLPLLELRDIEQSLCEFDKYERVRLGEGRPRAKFTPGKELP